jgi:hypothetical protein
MPAPGVARSRARAGVRRRKWIRAEVLEAAPELDRPRPYRTLKRTPAPPALYATPWPARATGSYGGAAVKWLERHLPKWRAQDWQRQALELALAHDRRGRILARTCLIMTPRQNGKTTLAQALIGWYMDQGPGGQIVGAATERAQARRVYDLIYRLFAADPDLAARARITAHEGIYLGSSTYQTISREAGSARGFTAALVLFDELLTQKNPDTWDALRYAQAAAPNPLLVATSTAGFADSAVLNELEDRGIRIATGAEKPDPAFAFLKWGCPDYANPDDDAAIIAANPAIASGLLTLADIRAEQKTSLPGSFRRERMNQRTMLAEQVLPPGAWESCRAPIPADPDRYYLAVDMAPHGQRATLTAAWELPNSERIALEVARDLRATTEAPLTAAQLGAAVLEVTARRMPLGILYERSAAATPALERLAIDHPDLPLIPMTSAQVYEACGVMYLAVLTRRLAQVGDPLLAAQWGQVARVERDSAYRWARRKSASYIDAVMSATLSTWAAARGEAQDLPPQIFV